MRVCVAYSAVNNITIIDLVSNKVVGEFEVSRNPHGIVPSPDNSRFYLSNEGENALGVVDLLSRRATAQARVFYRTYRCLPWSERASAMKSIYYVMTFLCHRQCPHCYEERFHAYYGDDLEGVVTESRSTSSASSTTFRIE